MVIKTFMRHALILMVSGELSLRTNLSKLSEKSHQKIKFLELKIQPFSKIFCFNAKNYI